MTDGKFFKLTYNNSVLRVRASFACKDMRTLTEIPQDLYVRMHNKMRSEVQKGRCRQYSTYLPRLEKVHEMLKADKDGLRFPNDLLIHMTLAAGIPDIPGISFHANKGSGEDIGVLKVRIKTQILQRFHPKTFILTVQKLVLEAGKRVRTCEAQLMSVYFKTLGGSEQADYQLHKTPAMPVEAGGDKPYAIFPESDNKELKVLINDPEKFRKPGLVVQLYRDLQEACQAAPVALNIWKNLIKTEISLSLHGVEIFGILTPLTLLAATSAGQPAELTSEVTSKAPAPQPEKPAQKKAEIPGKQKSPPAVPDSYPGKDLLNLEISDDQLKALIRGFSMLNYERQDLNLDETWLRNELTRLGIRNLDNNLITRANDSLVRKRDLNGIQVAEGIPATEDSEPAIIPISEFLDVEDKKDSSPESDTQRADAKVDHRSMRGNFIMVKKGQMIAKLIFKTPGKDGYDVFGNTVPRPVPKTSVAIPGEGVKSDQGLDFYATQDGMMKINDLEISVIHAFHHKGDVNLTSGNISFTGPVYIEGHVDSGASVYSSDSIHISGQIRGGRVFCKKDLFAEKGIITNLNNRLYCGGNLRTPFIENSVIDCRGNMQIQRAIISSEVNCGGDIQLTGPESVCGGSEICLWGNLSTHDLGFAKGKVTRVLLGYDWKGHRRLKIAEKRFVHFSRVYKKIKGEFQELARKDKRQMSKKMMQQKESLQKSNLRLKKIVKYLEEKIASLQKNQSDNKDSHIRVAGMAYMNCTIIVKDKELSIPSQLEGIAILATAKKDQHIISLDKFKGKTESAKSKKAG